MKSKINLIINIDYYLNSNGDLVFTKEYHLKRGHCCQSGCLHCPYTCKDKIDPNVPLEFRDAWSEENYSIDTEEDD